MIFHLGLPTLKTKNVGISVKFAGKGQQLLGWSEDGACWKNNLFSSNVAVKKGLVRWRLEGLTPGLNAKEAQTMAISLVGWQLFFQNTVQNQCKFSIREFSHIGMFYKKTVEKVKLFAF